MAKHELWVASPPRDRCMIGPFLTRFRELVVGACLAHLALRGRSPARACVEASYRNLRRGDISTSSSVDRNAGWCFTSPRNASHRNAP
jgi:hypothetical protein